MAQDLTTEILIQIRDEIRKTNERLDSTNERLDSTNERLDSTNERLERLEARQTETELRLATELVAVASAVRELKDALGAGSGDPRSRARPRAAFGQVGKQGARARQEGQLRSHPPLIWVAASRRSVRGQRLC